MRGAWTAVLGGALAAAAAAAGVAYGRDLGAREAGEQIAALLGAPAGSVRIKSISKGLVGNDAVVEAQVQLAFRMTERPEGWRVAEVRLGDGTWEDVELVRRAVDAEKARRAGADLRAVAAGVEAYRQERGFYPASDDFRGLVDRLSPRFLPRVVREDPWHRPFYAETAGSGYRLGSEGPDGQRGSADDVVVTGAGEGPSL